MAAAPILRSRLAARILLVAGAAAAQIACRGGTPAVHGAGSAGTTGSGGAHATAGGTGGAGLPDGGTGGMGGAGGSDAGLPSGGAGALGAGGSGGAGGAGGGVTLACFGWPDDAGAPDAGSCPTNEIDVLVEFVREGCPTGWIPHRILSPPTMTADACCYEVVLGLCPCGGRPFLEGGAARVSAAVRGAPGAGWVLDGASGPDDRAAAAPLSPGDRAALVDAWTADGLAEHASIASFARLALALLAAGAPADLVALAHEAARDEVDHAALAFARASAYAGERVAPGPFPLGGSVRVEATFAALAASTVHEGCVGETVAAAIAAERLDRATDPAVRAALAQIAEDEARHAEFAWRVVAWALREGGAEVAAAVRGAFVAALAPAAGEAPRVGDDRPEDASDAARAGHGQPGAASLSRAARRALIEIVVPGARTLLGRPS